MWYYVDDIIKFNIDFDNILIEIWKYFGLSHFMQNFHWNKSILY